MPVTIKWDVDGVLLDHLTPWVQVVNAVFHTDLKPADVTRWEWGTLVGDPERVNALRMPELYRVMKPMPGAQAAVKCFARLGFRQVVVSHDYASHAKEKAAAIRRLFPLLNTIVFAQDKNTVVRGGILIDDYHGNKPDILIDAPYNREADWDSYGIRAFNVFHARLIAERLALSKEYHNAPSFVC